MENAIWALAGFLLGLIGSVIVERYNRFRAVLEQAARVIKEFNQTMYAANTALELSLMEIELMRNVQFEFRLQGQMTASERLEKIRDEIFGVVHRSNIDVVNRDPSTAKALDFAKGEQFEATKIVAGDRIGRTIEVYIDRVLAIEADWLVLCVGRSLGLKIRIQGKLLSDYLHDTGELKKKR